MGNIFSEIVRTGILIPIIIGNTAVAITLIGSAQQLGEYKAGNPSFTTAYKVFIAAAVIGSIIAFYTTMHVIGMIVLPFVIGPEVLEFLGLIIDFYSLALLAATGLIFILTLIGILYVTFAKDDGTTLPTNAYNWIGIAGFFTAINVTLAMYLVYKSWIAGNVMGDVMGAL